VLIPFPIFYNQALNVDMTSTRPQIAQLDRINAFDRILIVDRHGPRPNQECEYSEFMGHILILSSAKSNLKTIGPLSQAIDRAPMVLTTRLYVLVHENGENNVVAIPERFAFLTGGCVRSRSDRMPGNIPTTWISRKNCKTLSIEPEESYKEYLQRTGNSN
jgi:hypothetical protein